MTPSRKNPGVAFWATVVVVVVLVAYPLSFGPACWLASRDLLPAWAVLPLMVCYHPLNWIRHLPPPAKEALDWYIGLWKNPSS